MTMLELAERDLRRAEMNLKGAHHRPGTPDSEMLQLTELLRLRRAMAEIIRRAGRT